MLIYLQELISCFEEDAVIKGVMQEQQFTIHINPARKPTLHCLSFNGTNSTAIINYDQLSTSKTLTTTFFYTSTDPLDLAFIVPDEADFDFITTLSIISYTIVLGEKLPIPGTFAKIQHTQVNTSNCWQDVALVYDRPKSLKITATPNYCLIPTPEVSLQYQVGQMWVSIPISLDPTSAEGGFKLPFDHMKTTFYETSETEQEAISKFFVQFELDRQTEVRLSLRFSQAGSALQQEIFGVVGKIETVNSSCIEGINSRSIVTVLGVQNVGYLSSLTGCYDSLTVMVTSVFYGIQFTNEEPTASLASKTAIVFYFSSERPDILLSEIEGVAQQLYITFYDADKNIIAEQTSAFQPILSCFYDIKTLISLKQTCLVFFPTLTESCLELYKDGMITQQQQMLQMNSSTTSRLHYQVYQERFFIQNTSYYKQCYGQKNHMTESPYPLQPGNYLQRQRNFISNLKKAQMPCVTISSEVDFKFSYELGIDENGLILTYLVVIFVMVFLAVCGLIVFVAVKLQ